MILFCLFFATLGIILIILGMRNTIGRKDDDSREI